ncbi:6-phosphogluconolactonase [Neolewinella lacunae]|uniref:6-phosphogluconolactonase n=1 Tax=Neolewinella lacunae TaxID=1517758 RepID=A0A923PLT3_9BACT|nr:6-phosphogluconolactonase [Neolewinella lacunae]MBC6996405.1 6-phosphogluconolactonase [Neolewinella lacunae]MDN3633652.1 6-phosphogluconolactonase [Neolewinella lacunae]
MSYQPHLHVFTDGPAVARGFAEHLVQRLAEHPAGPFFWALSGGSTPKLLFSLLAKEYRERIDWQRIHFFWGDERCVPHDHPESNYGEVRKLLFDHVPVVADQVHAVDTSLEPAAAAAAYAELMQRLLPSNTDGLPSLDLNMLGMGEDGHTASIFPHNMAELMASPAICAVATHPSSGQLRVTMTGPVLNASAEVVFLITGNSKTQRVAQILHREPHAETFPVAHIQPGSGRLHWFLDGAAAAEVGY